MILSPNPSIDLHYLMIQVQSSLRQYQWCLYHYHSSRTLIKNLHHPHLLILLSFYEQYVSSCETFETMLLGLLTLVVFTFLLTYHLPSSLLLLLLSCLLSYHLLLHLPSSLHLPSYHHHHPHLPFSNP